MNAPETRAEPTVGSAGAGHKTIAVIGAWICIGVPLVVVALLYLF
jgi:hypothetical protein